MSRCCTDWAVLESREVPAGAKGRCEEFRITGPVFLLFAILGRKEAGYAAVVRDRFLAVAQDADGTVGFGRLDEARAEVEAVHVLPGRQGEGMGGSVLRSLEADGAVNIGSVAPAS